MKLRIAIVIFIIFSGFTRGNCGIGKADTTTCDSGQLVISIECVPTIEGTPLGDADIIIAHYNDQVYSAVDTINYSPASENTTTLAGLFLETVDSFIDSLTFSIYSASGQCKTSLVNYHYDESASNYCFIRIDSLEASLYTIGYPADVLCLGSDSVSPVTNVPGNSIIYNSDSLFCLNNTDGTIFPDGCQPGNFTITFSSDYCLSTSYFNISIDAPSEIGLEDTIALCSEGPVNNLGEYEQYTFYTSDSVDTYNYSDITEEGVYIVGLDRQSCSIPDTVYVRLVESPLVDLILTEECDRVIVQINDLGGDVHEINWWNGEVGNQVGVYNETFLGYTVTNESGCSSSDSFNITPHTLGMSFVDYEKEDATCWNDGNISISQATVINNVGLVQYQLRNTINNRVYDAQATIPEGLYSLEVVDERNCTAGYEEQITIVQRCLEDFPVFTPNGDDIEDLYFIPHEGEVKIYNLKGELMRTIITPDYWDGNDETGTPLPMGTYAIITDTGRIVNITIVK